MHLKIALPAGFQIEYIKYNALNCRNMEIPREALRFKALPAESQFPRVVSSVSSGWCRARQEQGDVASGGEGQEPDGVLGKEEMLLGSWQGGRVRLD